MADILPPAPVDAPFGAYGWVDWYKKVRDAINNGGSVAWSIITGKPTTFGGYGISDTSANLATALTDETGTGQAVFNTSPTLVSPALGAATGTSLVLTGDITTGSGTLHKTSAPLTNAAAAQAATLLNSPVMGNPTKWVPVNDNGTIRYVPLW